MGTKQNSRKVGLADALFSPVQQRVLSLLFGQPARRFQSGELIRMARGGTGAVHRQLERLATSGWITVTRSGNQKHYQANHDAPAFAELYGLVLKTVGVVDPIRDAIAPLRAAITSAFVYGSVARREATATSDVDLMVVTDRLTYPDLMAKLQPVESRIGRPINVTIMKAAEWRAQHAKPDSFATRIARQPKLFVLGADGDLP